MPVVISATKESVPVPRESNRRYYFRLLTSQTGSVTGRELRYRSQVPPRRPALVAQNIMHLTKSYFYEGSEFFAPSCRAVTGMSLDVRCSGVAFLFSPSFMPPSLAGSSWPSLLWAPIPEARGWPSFSLRLVFPLGLLARVTWLPGLSSPSCVLRFSLHLPADWSSRPAGRCRRSLQDPASAPARLRLDPTSQAERARSFHTKFNSGNQLLMPLRCDTFRNITGCEAKHSSMSRTRKSSREARPAQGEVAKPSWHSSPASRPPGQMLARSPSQPTRPSV